MQYMFFLVLIGYEAIQVKTFFCMIVFQCSSSKVLLRATHGHYLTLPRKGEILL